MPCLTWHAFQIAMPKACTPTHSSYATNHQMDGAPLMHLHACMRACRSFHAQHVEPAPGRQRASVPHTGARSRTLGGLGATMLADSDATERATEAGLESPPTTLFLEATFLSALSPASSSSAPATPLCHLTACAMLGKPSVSVV